MRRILDSPQHYFSDMLYLDLGVCPVSAIYENQMTINKLFTEETIVKKIQARLPELFYLAELESSRAGKVGMEVGSARERILIALLIYKFGKANVETDIPITEPEVDVKVFGNPVSIKTCLLYTSPSPRD